MKEKLYLIVSFAGCALLSLGGYKLFTEARTKSSTNYAEDAIPNVGHSPEGVDDSKGLKSITDSDSLMYLFESWSKLNRKLYKSREDKMRKFEVFKANVNYVEKRSKALTEYEVGLEHFPHLDREDFVQRGYLVGLFEWWIKEMKGNTYKSPQEKLYRFERFKETVKAIEKGNKKLSTSWLGLNPYADFSKEDWKSVAGARICSQTAAAFSALENINQ